MLKRSSADKLVEFQSEESKSVSPLLLHSSDSSEKINVPPSPSRANSDPSAPSTSAIGNNYYVFLSFRGPDTRNGFVDHLYNRLQDVGLRFHPNFVFRDDKDLPFGQDIAANLISVIRHSKVSIPVISENYAASEWCLRELIHMMECMESRGQIVLPVLYKVKPKDVRHLDGSFGEAFKSHMDQFKEEVKQQGPVALIKAVACRIFESEEFAHGHEGELVNKLVKIVMSKQQEDFQPHLPVNLVGLDYHVAEVMKLVNTACFDTRIIGIYGISGIGKTTLATIIYKNLFDKFEYHSFLMNIRENINHQGIEYVQSRLISDILKMPDYQVHDSCVGIHTIQSNCKEKKVLVLLDDVDKKEHLKNLIGDHNFMSGSTIIVTCQDKAVLESEYVYGLKEMNIDDSLLLFRRYAFEGKPPPEELETLSHGIVATTGGLPLALVIIGSLLKRNNDPRVWREMRDKLRKAPNPTVQEKLMISYNTLEYNEKQMFLDIACFFIGTDKRIAIILWDAIDWYPASGLAKMTDLSLIQFDENNELRMHDQLRDLGRDIARPADKKLWRCQRLWGKEATKVLGRQEVNEYIEALHLDESSSSKFMEEASYKRMPNLKFLHVSAVDFVGDFKKYLLELRWLKWERCLDSFKVTNFHLEKLVILDLSGGKIRENWRGWSSVKIERLKVLNLSWCSYLKSTPCLSGFRSLEMLILKNCENLEEIDPSIGDVTCLVSLVLRSCRSLKKLPAQLGEVKGLISLDLWECENIRVLPEQMDKLEELKELIIGRTAIEEIPPCIGSLKKLKILDDYGCESLIGLASSVSHPNNKKSIWPGASSSSTTATGSEYYDVFLSFDSNDTRKTFVDHLYNFLVDAGIHVFRDGCEPSEDAIKNSKILIPVLSHNYASSKWTLQELVQMIECMKGLGHVVLPIFYHVTPANVRYQNGHFGKALSRLSRKYSEEDVVEWKQALQEVASLKGWESEKIAQGHEGELVKIIGRKVLSELKKAFQLVVPEQLVGIDNAVKNVFKLLDDNPCATQIVGIHGMGGIGKTTLAKIVYNKLSDQFQNRSFIADIRESSQDRGILFLQNQLISDILKMKDQASSMDEGIKIMESRFRCKKVLILLDDVDANDQLKALVGKHDWFEMGSRIIITSRKRSVLDNAGVKCMYQVKEIAEDQSLILFSRHAFRRDFPPCEFESLSYAVISTIGGFPLTLEVIGSFLCGRNRALWHDVLKRLRNVPHKEVQEKLRMSYDALSYEAQEIFLDIACFLFGHDLRIASYMWDACDFYPDMHIETLRSLSLIKIGDHHEVRMHDQLRDLGRKIVRQNALIYQSRLWLYEEALEVLKRNQGIEKPWVRALCLHKNSSQSEFTTEQFETLPELRFLQVRDAKVTGDSRSLLPEMQWLAWNISPVFVATSFCLKKLVILDLSRSDVSELWEGWSHLKVAKHLKVLNLTECCHLKVTPDLSVFQNLEILVLEGCHNLEQIHPSIGEVKDLVFWNLMSCKKLRELPREMGKLEKLKELDIRMTTIRDIPPCICSLMKLEMLNAYGCELLVGLPDSIGHLINLSTLDLRDCFSLYRLPTSIGSLVKLQRLSLGGIRSPNCRGDSKVGYCLYHIPDSIGKLEWLTELNLSFTGIRELPESIGDLKNLKLLNIANIEDLSNLPKSISKLGKLEQLVASHCKSLGGKFFIDGLSSLKILELSWTRISGFTDAIDNLSHLENLNLRGCDMLQLLPQSIGKLPSLQQLDITYCNKLQSLPKLPAGLTVLGVTCQDRTLPQLSHLIHLKEVTVEHCRLLESMLELPFGILKLRVGNCYELKELPCLSSLKFLSILDLEMCFELTEIKGLEALKSLTKLNVTGCRKLSNLGSLEHLESMRCLDMSWLSKSDAPQVNDDLVQVRGLDKLKNLEELHIFSCQSLIRPDLSQLTHLKRLNTGECHNLVEIKGLERMKNLEKLDLHGCRSIETLPDLSCFDNLRDLSIGDCWKLRDVQCPEKVAYVSRW